jgi:hypothetical protein
MMVLLTASSCCLCRVYLNYSNLSIFLLFNLQDSFEFFEFSNDFCVLLSWLLSSCVHGRFHFFSSCFQGMSSFRDDYKSECPAWAPFRENARLLSYLCNCSNLNHTVSADFFSLLPSVCGRSYELVLPVDVCMACSVLDLFRIDMFQIPVWISDLFKCRSLSAVTSNILLSSSKCRRLCFYPLPSLLSSFLFRSTFYDLVYIMFCRSTFRILLIEVGFFSIWVLLPRCCRCSISRQFRVPVFGIHRYFKWFNRRYKKSTLEVRN